MLTKMYEGAITAAFAVAALLGLGWAVRQGWLPAIGVGMVVVGYIGFAGFTVVWAIQAGGEAAGQKKPLLGNLLYWHGVCVIVTLMLAAAGLIALVSGMFLLRGF